MKRDATAQGLLFPAKNTVRSAVLGRCRGWYEDTTRGDVPAVAFARPRCPDDDLVNGPSSGSVSPRGWQCGTGSYGWHLRAGLARREALAAARRDAENRRPA